MKSIAQETKAERLQRDIYLMRNRREIIYNLLEEGKNMTLSKQRCS